MRILLTHHFPLTSTSTGRFATALARALQGAGHDVRLLAVEAVSPTGDFSSTVGGLLVRRVSFRANPQAAELPSVVAWFAREAAGSPSFEQLSEEQLSDYREAFRQALDQEVAEFDPHVIHVQHLWLQAQLALETGVPYVATLWGPELSSCDQNTRLRGLVVQAAENVGRVIVSHEPLASRARQVFEAARDRVRVIPPAIDLLALDKTSGTRPAVLAQFHLAPDSGPVVAAIAPLAPDSGLEALLNAAARYERQPAGITTIIAGSGPLLGELQAQAARLGLNGVHFLTECDAQAVLALARLADVCVVPALEPTAWYDALTALAVGTPVIAALSAELPEMTDPSMQRTVEGDDHERLGSAIVESIDNKTKAAHGRESSLRVRQRHSLSSIVAQYTRLYEDIWRERFGRAPE